MRILGVHGVGSPVPGWLLDLLAGESAKRRKNEPLIREDLILSGIPYPRARDERDSTEIVEVNWSDIHRPLYGFVGVAWHFLLLLSSMLTVPLSQCPPTAPGRSLLWAYRVTFEGFLFWNFL